MGKQESDDGPQNGQGEESYPMVPLKDDQKESSVDVLKYKAPKKKKGILDLISAFAEKCSLSGVSFIHSTKYLTVKIIWTVLLLASLCVMIYHLNELTKKFYLYEKQTQISLSKSNLPFPAVTLCNVNIMRHSKLFMASRKMRKLVEKVDPDRLTNYVNDWEPAYEDQTVYVDDEDDELVRRKRSEKQKSSYTVKSRNTNFFDDFNITDIEQEEEFDDNDFSGQVYKDSWESESRPASLDRLLNRFTALYLSENSTTRRRMGHQIQDMLIQCSFAGRKCFQKNFTVVESSTLGNCYTLQYDKFVSRQSGPGQGVSLMLYLESDEYVAGLTNSKGVQVVIHDPGTVPFPDSEGIAVSAGMNTAIGLKKLDIKRLGQPHGDCRENADFNQKYGMKYTAQTCNEVCLMEKVKDDCSCYDETKPIFYKRLKRKYNIKACQSKKELLACMRDVKWNFHFSHDNCDCFSPCRETTYSQIISAKPWPNDAMANLIASTVCKEKVKLCDHKDMDVITLRENFLKLSVYFETLDFEELHEVEDYTTFQFVSDIGGTIGLYVGLSVLGFFEFVHLFITVLRYFLCRNWSPA